MRIRRFFYAVCLAVYLLQMGAASALEAETVAWVRSLPYAISEERLYKVRIERIDGRPVSQATQYELSPGPHDVDVSLMLRIEWASGESSQRGGTASKALRLQASAGRLYQLAARVDTSASEERVAQGDYWQPMVYDISDLP